MLTIFSRVNVLLCLLLDILNFSSKDLIISKREHKSSQFGSHKFIKRSFKHPN